MKTLCSTLMGMSFLLCACSSYKELPLDLMSEAHSWSLQSQALAKQGLTKAQAEQVGLLMNPTLNLARLKYATSADVEKQVGWWNDPSLSFEGKRVLQEGGFNFDSGGLFTIPVTGLPHLQQELASHYKEADYWQVKSIEMTFLKELSKVWIEYSLAQESFRLISHRLSVLKGENEQINQLVQAGELVVTESHLAQQRFDTLQRSQQEIQSTLLVRKQAIARLLGLRSDCVVHLILEPLSVSKVPSAVAIPQSKLLIQSPQIKSQLALYAISETKLKTEIRRQYPELALGPVFTRDDGEKELGLSFGFDVPLWNRNRQAIAESEGDRSIVRSETIQLWRDLLQTTQELNQCQQSQLEQCLAAYQRKVKQNQQVTQLEKLYQLGESTMGTLAETRQQAYESELAYLESLAQLLQTQSQIRFLTGSNL